VYLSSHTYFCIGIIYLHILCMYSAQSLAVPLELQLYRDYYILLYVYVFLNWYYICLSQVYTIYSVTGGF